jgi:hypothetical protein
VLPDQGLQSIHRVETGLITPRRALQAIELRKFDKRAVDLPQQHGGACHGAALPRRLAIDQDDVETPASKPFRRERACYSRADDQNVTVKIGCDGTNVA